MKKRYAYFYFMINNVEKIPQVVPAHVEYWKERKLNNYLGGPFADRSGGLITFTSESLENAAQIVNDDPFIIENLIENKWLKEWVML